MSTLDDFDKLDDYFVGNFARATAKYSEHRDRFREIYNRLNKHPEQITAAQGTSLAVLMRGMKFLYTAFDLVQRGHVHEAQIILRNVQELRLVALDLATDESAYQFWTLAQEIRRVGQIEGIIDSRTLKKSVLDKYGVKNGGKIISGMTVEASLKRLKNKNNDYISAVLADIVGSRNTLSEHISHENMFNLVRRIDVIKREDGQEDTAVYLGVDADSHLDSYLEHVIKVLKGLSADIDFVRKHTF